MNLRDLDLNLLLVLHQLLIDRQVSSAADNLGLTQPAMSNALKRLRSTLNDELFVRSGRSMQPTPYAEQLAQPVAQAIALLHQALQRPAAFDPASSRRRFTLAMTDIGEIYFMPQLIDTLLQRAPGLSVTTVRSDAQLSEALASGAIDLAVGLQPNLQSGFYQRRLFVHRYVVLCRHDHPLAGQAMTAQAFARQSHVHVAAASTGHGEVEQYLRRAGLQRDIRLEVPHFVAVGHILQRSDLVATVPERFASTCLQPFGLVALPLPVPLPEITINLFWHARFHKEPANQWFRDLMFELFSD
ncbi:LysR family transcriptional regulator [Pseudomonas sp. LJDD11]|uniref:LysR family transcriptional regulator n=1 Tax=unclassified Pseudomonas TaxID=196821 RepID=UPI0004F85469|nr:MULTISPECIES: LysR family transcriptional regulator [unclassified Pseudomonas]MCO8164948.1 LysR family transcriptional regulator [Pseudomonas sp. 21LCFQ010]MCQ9422924.1 LysR family transcriptional regulator [Pseudomonas sp. LJDD11]BAP45260.1 naphthalene degradation LysR-family transcriptional activator [Pseudomonas sp. StFLB209]